MCNSNCNKIFAQSELLLPLDEELSLLARVHFATRLQHESSATLLLELLLLLALFRDILRRDRVRVLHLDPAPGEDLLGTVLRLHDGASRAAPFLERWQLVERRVQAVGVVGTWAGLAEQQELALLKILYNNRVSNNEE